MKGYMYPPTLTQLKTLEKEQLRHQKKLELIQSANRFGKLRESSSTLSMRVTAKPISIERASAIERENNALLTKLVDITKKKATVSSRGSNTGYLKSLHAPFRKREMDRISAENEALAKRILSQQSNLGQKTFTDSFKKHQVLVSQIKKVGTSPMKLSSSSAKLPPLTADQRSVKNMDNGTIENNKQLGLKDQMVGTKSITLLSKDIKLAVSTTIPSHTKQPDNDEHKTVQEDSDAFPQIEAARLDERNQIQDPKTTEIPNNEVTIAKQEGAADIPTTHVDEGTIPKGQVEETEKAVDDKPNQPETLPQDE